MLNNLIISKLAFNQNKMKIILLFSYVKQQVFLPFILKGSKNFNLKILTFFALFKKCKNLLKIYRASLIEEKVIATLLVVHSMNFIHSQMQKVYKL